MAIAMAAAIQLDQLARQRWAYPQKIAGQHLPRTNPVMRRGRGLRFASVKATRVIT